MSSSGTILVTGATGQTGQRTVELLRERGHRVRALVHTVDARSRKLAEAGADVVAGDLQDLNSVRAALTDVQSAYFVYPVELGLLQATSLFAFAAHEAGVQALVNMSQMPARPDAASAAMREHWLSERVLDWAPVPVTHLRPTLFAEWLTIDTRSVAIDGVLRLPMGQGRHAPIAAEDISHVAAAILESPEAHTGNTYPLTGPVEMDHGQMAAIMSEVLGRTVIYAPMDDAHFARALEAQGRSPHLIQHLTSVVEDYRHGLFSGTNRLVEEIGDTKPTSVAEFIEAHREQFKTSDS